MKKNQKLLIALLFLFGSTLQNSLLFGQGANCAAASTIAINSVTATVTINAASGTPALTGCTGSAILSEGWFKFTATTSYSAITFSNLGNVTAYAYIYSGTCGAQTNVTCMSITNGNINLVNFATVSGQQYYIRIVKVDIGTVTGRVGVYSNAGTNAILCTPDKAPMNTGNANQLGSKFDNVLNVGDLSGTIYADNYSVGFVKFNTTNVPQSNITVNGIAFALTYSDALLGAGGDKQTITKLKSDAIDPVAATASQIYQQSNTTTKFYGDIGPNYISNTTYIYPLLAAAAINFTARYTQSWWGLCVPVEWLTFYLPGDNINYYGWNSSYTPYIVVTYTPSNCTSPTITTQPTASVSQCAGTDISLSIAADGTAPLNYQWKKATNSITNAINPTLNLTNITSGDAASYACTVSNACGNIVSNAAVVTVNTPPIISSKTPDRIKCTRDSVLFKLKINATPVPSFQWAKNGTDIQGATNSSYYMGQILPSNAGAFTCKISNSCGSTSATISLSVDNSPFIQDTIPNQSACEGSNVTFLFHATGTNLKYQWAKIGGIIAGATTSAFTMTNLKLSDGNTYTCSVSNSCDSKVLKSFTLSINQKPTINFSPLNLTKKPGDSLIYTLQPTGLELIYKWMKNNTVLTGKTTNPFKIKPILCSDAGTYSVVISNVCGSTSALAGTLTVDCSGTFTLSGYVQYDNTALKPMANTTVYLINSESVRISSTQTDVNGLYKFLNLSPDVYSLECETSQAWGGVTPADALLILKHFIGLYTFIDALTQKTSDVNLDNKINQADALLINKRYVHLISKFTAADWIFESIGVTIGNSDVQKNIKAICAGDVNASYSW